MPASTVHVDGLAALEKALKDLDENVAKKAMRNATAAGGRLVRDLMRQKAPRDKGDLAKGINVSTRADVANGRFTAKVKPSNKPPAGNKKKPSPASEALWNEFGVKPHAEGPLSKKALAFDPTKGGLGSNARVIVRQIQHPGIAPNPFMRAAADEGLPKAVGVFKDALTAAIDKAQKK